MSDTNLSFSFKPQAQAILKKIKKEKAEAKVSRVSSSEKSFKTSKTIITTTNSRLSNNSEKANNLNNKNNRTKANSSANSNKNLSKEFKVKSRVKNVNSNQLDKASKVSNSNLDNKQNKSSTNSRRVKVAKTKIFDKNHHKTKSSKHQGQEINPLSKINDDDCPFLVENLADSTYPTVTSKKTYKDKSNSRLKYEAKFNDGNLKVDHSNLVNEGCQRDLINKKLAESKHSYEFKVAKGKEQASTLACYGIKSYHEAYFHNPRFQAAYLVKEVLEDKRSLNIDLDGMIDKQDIGFASELAFGVVRYLPQLNFIANKLLLKPFNANCYFAHLILLQSLYQLIYMTRAEHAAVYENVELAKQIYGQGVAKVLNACLRNFLRNETELVEQSKNISLLPKWFERCLTLRIPDEFYSKMNEAMNSKPPFWIRVNTTRVNLEEFMKSLEEAGHEYYQHPYLKTAIQIKKPVSVLCLPGYYDGYFSVQDLHAQLAAVLLTQPTIQDAKTVKFNLTTSISDTKSVSTLNSNSISQPIVWDSCCSPGGKTTHLLELLPQATMVASDIDGLRIERVHQNLNRLHQRAFVVQGDALHPERWLDKVNDQLNNQSNEFDLILLDVPCSGTGVIRRHPDIKWLRQQSDIIKLHNTQLDILTRAWKYLKVGGKLLYTSCSILGEENEQVVKEFIANTTNVEVVNIDEFSKANIFSNSIAIDIEGPGLQLINSKESGDGFYYCLLTKTF